MSEPLIAILAVLGVAAFIGLAYLAYRFEKQRTDALAELAKRLGWEFRRDKEHLHSDNLAHFAVFRRGHSRKRSNTMRGEVEIAGRRYEATMGDFSYKETRQSTNSRGTTSRNTTTYKFSYMLVQLPFADVPPLLIRREGFFDKVAGFFGGGGISFESEEFSRAFHVNSPDRKFAYDVITPRMMEFLMEGKPGAVEIEQGCCCICDGSRRWKPEQFEANLEWIKSFFELWPEHLKVSLEDRAAARADGVQGG